VSRNIKYTALITGASSGIGKAIANRLLDSGYFVISLGRSFEDTVSKNCEQIKCDLRDIKQIEKSAKNILKKYEINILINCAGFGEFRPHEELGIDTIDDMINLNLKAPILLTNLFLRSLKKEALQNNKSHIINITSIEALKHSKFSALYTSTKSGLRDFSLSLFEELRKSGVRVTSLNPDMTQTEFFDDLSFECSDDENSYILADTIASTVLEVINSNSVITDLTIRAQKFGIKKK
jgi:short-subunit dehydrogenase